MLRIRFAAFLLMTNILFVDISYINGDTNDLRVCNLEPEQGLCYGYIRRYFFNKVTRTCQLFIYGGCGGNENRFETRQECEDFCL